GIVEGDDADAVRGGLEDLAVGKGGFVVGNVEHRGLLSSGVGRRERADIGAGEGRPRLYSSPPFGNAGMVLFGYLLRHDLLIDPLDEGTRRDIGDRIGLADQPAGAFQRLFHAVEQLMSEFVPRGLTLLLGIGLARDAEPCLLALLARYALQ